jgi:hypothetical protein
MTRWLVVAALIALSGCGVLPAASPRVIGQLTVTFTPSEPGPDAVSREQAIQGARERSRPGGHQLAAVPDVVEFGMAACLEHEPQCMGPGGNRPRPVWVVEWTPAPGRDHGTLIVDGLSGELLIGYSERP